MYGLMAHMSDGSKRAIDDLCNAREMAFVVTDLESSTAQASASAAAFAKVQEIHDTVRSYSPQSQPSHETNVILARYSCYGNYNAYFRPTGVL